MAKVRWATSGKAAVVLGYASAASLMSAVARGHVVPDTYAESAHGGRVALFSLDRIEREKAEARA